MSYATQLLQSFENAHAAAHQAASGSPQIPTPEKFGTRFEQIWPKAVPVLQSVVKVVQFIPGLSAAGPVLSGLMAMGDALAAAKPA